MVGVDIWKDLLGLLNENNCELIVCLWVPSHCGIVRNELADKEADRAFSELSDPKHQRLAPIHLDAIKAEIKLSVKELWKKSLDNKRFRYRSAGKSKFTDLGESSKLSRNDETLLAQLRCGHCYMLGKVRKYFTGDKWDGKCRWCLSAVESVEHIFNECKSGCIVLEKREAGILNTNDLHSKPKECAKFIKNIFGKEKIGNI